MVDFNKHFKSSHDPLQCRVCKEDFSTPSALHRHRYRHKDLRYACSKCGKQFPFSSDRDNHEINHCKVKMHHCIQPGYNKSYLRKGELTAHALTHKKGHVYKCSLCKYNTKIQNLLVTLVQSINVLLWSLYCDSLKCIWSTVQNWHDSLKCNVVYFNNSFVLVS